MERRLPESRQKDNKEPAMDDDDDDDEEEAMDGSGVGEDEKKRRSSSYNGGITVGVRRGGSGGGSLSQPCCQVEKCAADFTDAKRYHRRHKVCEAHFKAPVVMVAGLRQRFCQQCSRICSRAYLSVVLGNEHGLNFFRRITAGSMSYVNLMKQRGVVADVWLATISGGERALLILKEKARVAADRLTRVR